MKERRLNEDYVRDKLKLWLKSRYPNCPVKGPLRYVTSYKERKLTLAPDIDVAVGITPDELMGCEIKVPKGRRLINYISEEVRGFAPGVHYVMQSLKARGVQGIKEEKIQTLFQAGSDPEIYKGVGQALFCLRYVDRVYLVLPKSIHYMKSQQPLFLDTLIEKEILPIGLILFSFAEKSGLDFDIVHKAKKLALWKVDDLEAKVCDGNIRDRILKELFE